MAETRGARASGLGAGDTGGSDHHPQINWEAAERSPEFRELIRERRRFVVPATLFFLAWYFGFILLAGYAPDFMGESVYEGLTVGYCLAFTQFLMTWGLAALYLRRADSTFDPLAKKAAQRAVDVGHADETGADARAGMRGPR
ncbi:MAG TPA: DUF485 domain-containing protein [Thermoleophilaceae bacterium]|nr:DUF485 domain-containing protein [Thermoleophilaceae bacterium]